MTVDDIRAFDALLQASGAALSANKLVDRFGGSKRDALKLMRAYRAETQAPPAPPVEQGVPLPGQNQAPPPPCWSPPAPPLELAQAEQDHAAALMAVRQARRAYDFATDPREREGLEQPWRLADRHEKAMAQRRDQLQGSLAAAQQALPSLRIAARRSAGASATKKETNRRDELRLDRVALMDQKVVDDTTAAIVRIGGPQAVPRED